jgi:DNA-binding CsgD family transcriptional regulator
MHAPDELLALIGDIHDAALAPALWVEVLRRAAHFVGGQAGGLLSKNAVSRLGNAHYHYGVDPYYIRIYAETYSRFDPMATLQLFGVGQIVNIPNLVPYDEFRQGRFFKEWAEPQGWIDAANAILEKSRMSFSFISFMRNKESGMVDDEMRRRMKLVLPHLRRAVLIGNVIDLKAAEVATFNDTLDGLSAAVILVDETGLIVHANTSGEMMIAAGRVLRASNGRLIASEPKSDQALREVFIAAGSGDAGIGIEGIAVSLTASSEAPHVAHVLPLTSGMRRSTGIAYAAVAAVFVQEATPNIPSMQEVIAKHYKLTPTELRVLLAIAEIGSGPDVATALGVTSHTVKSHLHRLYEKTGASRQLDLVKLVARFNSPFNRPNGATT